MNDEPLTLAAPAPIDDAEDGAITDHDTYLHQLCEQWAHWCWSRRFYAKPSMPASLLGNLQKRTRPPGQPGGPDAIASAELLAFHLAVLGQPADALDRQVFELHYLHRVKNVKTAAAAVGIGRQHWYTLLREFRRRAHAASHDILEHNSGGASGCLPTAPVDSSVTNRMALGVERADTAAALISVSQDRVNRKGVASGT